MEQVSSLLTNILTIEENPSQTTISLQPQLKRSSLEATTVTETETVNAMGEMSKRNHNGNQWILIFIILEERIS